MEQSSSTSQRQPSSLFLKTNDKHSSEVGPSRSDISTTANEKTTSLRSPRPRNYYSDLSDNNYEDEDDYDDDYNDDRSNIRSKTRLYTARKRKAPSGIEAPSKLIIRESCIAGGISSSKLQSVRTKIELLEMQYPDDLPYIITFSRDTQTLYLECQECKKSLSLLKGGGNIGRHASGVLHSTCVDERLRKLEAKDFRRQLTNEVVEREKSMHSSPAFVTTMIYQRLCRQKQTSKQQSSELAPSENFESTPSSEDEPIRSKRQLIVAPSPTQSPANIPHPDLDMSDEMLTRYQGCEKRFEDAVIDINIRQSTQHRLLIDEVQKKISYGIVLIDNRLTALEKCVQESYQSTQHKELAEQRISKAWHSSESALRAVKNLEEDIKASEEKLSTGLNLVRELAEVVDRIEKGIRTSSEIDRVGRLEDEMKGVKEVVRDIRQRNIIDEANNSDNGPRNSNVSQSQPDTDRVATLQEEVDTLRAEVSNLAGLVENHELPTIHSSTANDAALIEDLKKSKGTIMKRLATSEERLANLEEQNDKLSSKIKELERR
ncbi:uncharacterized protein EAF02_004643 [Botrytis sinoallii]|uniref:uncharacterized protein n=1 Tax=Botrytis sinoallii TaxID=1463999 RepID=UPI0018FF7B12|nr:uncharacterized protein EAF02_004643 [Botrytis sinoallii]KAF7884307.1 hypothetical protein EAF02_004643 [Botrytis sinoallii]